MDSLNRLPSIIASLADTVGHCINALKNGGDVAQVASCLITTQQALSKLQPVLDTLVQLEDEESSALANIHSLAVELLCSLDETTTHYSPRPHAENVKLIHEIFLCYPEAPPPDNVVHLPVKKELPKAFSEAMHTHIALAEQHGEDSPQAKRSLMVAMQLAPDWFMDDVTSSMNDDLFPQANGYLANGEPVYKLEDIAAKFGLSIEEAAESLGEMIAIREELGLSNEGKIVDPSTVHFKQ